MVQDPDRNANERDQDVLLNTHALDMVTLPGGRVSTESEADMIRGVLDANEIPSLLIRAAQYPVLGFAIQVPRGLVGKAEQVVAEALAAGPEAAAEAEAQTEPKL
jgi:hypothetical protein